LTCVKVVFQLKSHLLQTVLVPRPCQLTNWNKPVADGGRQAAGQGDQKERQVPDKLHRAGILPALYPT
jgi:hypothetical protein